ncbi:unnamed protein product [Brassica napus]|nr:unnamed protein product [Brassica napus]
MKAHWASWWIACHRRELRRRSRGKGGVKWEGKEVERGERGEKGELRRGSRRKGGVKWERKEVEA